ncbi:PQQ-binding-like beta-propeller repeat protein [Pirellulaceae bacterium SH449]
MHSSRLRFNVSGWLSLMTLVLGVQIARGDWPEHRGTTQRSSFVVQSLPLAKWELRWEYNRSAPPQPAWPEPARGSLWQQLDYIEPRVDDDQGDAPVIGWDDLGKLHVLVPSSASDRLVSLDPVSGELLWEFYAGAPIRFAPSIFGGLAFFGSDDGIVRSVRLNDGSLLWESRIASDERWIVGNGRLISSHPIRTSVLVQGDRLYVCAGLFPSQNVYVAALNASTGETIWRHSLPKSPQGYLLEVDPDRFIAPEGRSIPFLIGTDDGEIQGSLPSAGGSFCMLTPDAFFAGPGNKKQFEGVSVDQVLNSSSSKSQPKMLPFQGRATAAGEGRIWVATGERLVCYDAQKIFAEAADSEIWSKPCTLKQSVIVSGVAPDLLVFVASGPNVEIYRAEDGELLHTLALPNESEEIVYLAVSDATPPELQTNAAQQGEKQTGKQSAVLVATTRSGAIYGFVSGEPSRDNDGSQQIFGNSKGNLKLSALSTPLLPRIEKLLAESPVGVGFALVLGSEEDSLLSENLIANSEFHVVHVTESATDATAMRQRWAELGIYGIRGVVRFQPASEPLPFAKQLFNVVIESRNSSRSEKEIESMLAPGAGVWQKTDGTHFAKRVASTAGAWRHQYAAPNNLSATEDAKLAQTQTLQLQWFGGVGPRPMPDRHLRGQAPLAAGGALVMHGDGSLIGVDPANGTQRWKLELPPGSMRYVMPFDAGYSCLTDDGATFYTATPDEIWCIDSFRGEIHSRIRWNDLRYPEAKDKTRSAEESDGLRWGYLAEWSGRLFASRMKPTAARLAIDEPSEARRKYSDQDYRSERPLVCSRWFGCLSPDGGYHWSREKGLVIHSTIALQSTALQSTAVDTQIVSPAGHVLFVEARGAAAMAHATDRVPMSVLMQDAYVVCLDMSNGKLLWEEPLNWQEAKNIIYLLVADDRVILVGSSSDEKLDVAKYGVRVLRLTDGSLDWESSHTHVRQGLYHGEQVHHPVVLQQTNGERWLVVEPFIYDLASGERRVPSGAPMDWSLVRPGHSCGSLSGCGSSLFFRATNPTVLNLQTGAGGKFTALAPSRPGCWINMIPSGGRLLIPEASASCVCNFPLQTSMAFVPFGGDE